MVITGVITFFKLNQRKIGAAENKDDCKSPGQFRIWK